METFTSKDIREAMVRGRGVYDEYEVDPNHPARPMQVVYDEAGNHWLCDKGVDVKRSLSAQGCWRCGDPRYQFMRQN